MYNNDLVICEGSSHPLQIERKLSHLNSMFEKTD